MFKGKEYSVFDLVVMLQQGKMDESQYLDIFENAYKENSIFGISKFELKKKRKELLDGNLFTENDNSFIYRIKIEISNI